MKAEAKKAEEAEKSSGNTVPKSRPAHRPKRHSKSDLAAETGTARQIVKKMEKQLGDLGLGKAVQAASLFRLGHHFDGLFRVDGGDGGLHGYSFLSIYPVRDLRRR